MYFLTVRRDGRDEVFRKPFEDYSDALEFLMAYYRPRSSRSVLTFSTEVINGAFARSYLSLNLPEGVVDGPGARERYALAVKHQNAYEYSSSYFFLIESQVGIDDADEDE